MLNLLLSPLTGLLKRLLGALGWYQAGKERERRKAAEEALERLQEADNATSEERKETAGLSDSDIVDRLRRRDGDWTGLR